MKNRLLSHDNAPRMFFFETESLGDVDQFRIWMTRLIVNKMFPIEFYLNGATYRLKNKEDARSFDSGIWFFLDFEVTGE